MNISILFVPSVSNPQFELLKSALVKNGCDVCSNINEFWSPSKHYDILHIQFPEFLNGFGYSKYKYIQRKRDKKTVDQLEYFKNSGTKIIWTAFNLKGHEQRHYGEKNIVYNELSKLCHGIITMGQSYHDFLRVIYPELKDKPLVVIPHGNYIDTYPNDITKLDARKMLNINEDRIVLLYFGLQRKYKNIYFIFKAFKIAYKRNKKLQLLIAGSPWGLKKRIFFKFLDIFYSYITVIPRFIKDDEVQIFFNASDIAIFSFKNMITSGSIILAQSFGLPVIVPNIGCFPDIVPKAIGFLYENDNIDSCVETILNCIQYDLKKIGRNARIAQESLTWNEIGLQTKSFYEFIIK